MESEACGSELGISRGCVYLRESRISIVQRHSMDLCVLGFFCIFGAWRQTDTVHFRDGWSINHSSSLFLSYFIYISHVLLLSPSQKNHQESLIARIHHVARWFLSRSENISRIQKQSALSLSLQGNSSLLPPSPPFSPDGDRGPHSNQNHRT